jgi:hypothetical protein
LIVLIVPLTLAACSPGESAHTKAEALYLLETLRQNHLLTQGKLAESHPLVHQMETYPGDNYALSPGQRYVWFTMGPEPVDAMQKARVSASDAGQSFAGFFLIIDEERRILDFGWHKP